MACVASCLCARAARRVEDNHPVRSVIAWSLMIPHIESTHAQQSFTRSPSCTQVGFLHVWYTRRLSHARSAQKGLLHLCSRTLLLSLTHVHRNIGTHTTGDLAPFHSSICKNVLRNLSLSVSLSLSLCVTLWISQFLSLSLSLSLS